MTGYRYQQNSGNPVSGGEDISEDIGDTYAPDAANANIPRVPDDVVENVYMTTEPIDPLYTDEYATCAV